MAGLAAVGLLVAGAGAAYVVMDRRQAESPWAPAADATARPADAPASYPPSAAERPGLSGQRAPDVVVPFTPEAIERAGIVVAQVVRGAPGDALRLPGIIEPNAYRQVVVTPLVAGRVTRVSAELGDRVRRGQSIAEVYSPELADAQAQYITARAGLEAHDRELRRTEKLLEIGAASRQELERVHAEHTAQTAGLASARSKLELLGLPIASIEALAPGTPLDATIDVPAPIDGIVTERTANVGLNVDPATRLMTVVDLSTVWVVAEAYESDFAHVRVGAAATVTTRAYPDQTLTGPVSYLDPQVNPATRAARLRIEVPNPRGTLKLGMYAEVAVASADRSAGLFVPRTAVQNVDARQVVYLSDPVRPGSFVERTVDLGRTAGSQVEVVSGLEAGDAVVVEGSFFVRAERDRLGQRPAGPTAASSPSDGDAVQRETITVGDQGFSPAQVTLRAGTRVRLTFVRTSEQTCATEVVFPSLDIRRALPLNEPVAIEFTPTRAGEVAFACGMNMLRGTAVVR
jgi:RND family efflux transporter MFP subunit